MTISVIIVLGRGREIAPLERALASLSAQSRPPDEVVLVLNGAEVPQRLATRLRIQLVPLLNDVGCVAGRNAGVRWASGDVLVFVDDDGQLDTHAIAAIEGAFAACPGEAAFAGRVVDPARSETTRPRGPDDTETLHFSGGAFAISRSAFLGCAGYSEDNLTRVSARPPGGGQGEELDLALNLLKRGVRVRRLNAFVLYHPLRSHPWASDELLLATANTIRVFWARLPLAVAALGTLWRVGAHSCRLVSERRLDRLAELAADVGYATSAGLRERDALNWHQYRASWRLIHNPKLVATLTGPRES